MRGRALRLAARLEKENPHYGFQRAAAGQIVRTSLRCKTGQGILYRLRFRFGQRCQATERPRGAFVVMEKRQLGDVHEEHPPFRQFNAAPD